VAAEGAVHDKVLLMEREKFSGEDGGIVQVYTFTLGGELVTELISTEDGGD